MEQQQFLSNAEFEAVLKSTPNPKHKVQLLLMHDAGLRVTECCRVTWEGCDFRNRTITIKSLKARKTDKTRQIPMSNRLYQSFVQYADKAGKKEGYCFADKEGKAPGRSAVNNLLKRVEAKTPEVERLHPHKLRHSFATNLRVNGATLEDIADTLGHSDLKTTRIYAHADTAKLRTLIELPAGRTDRSLVGRLKNSLRPRAKRPFSLVVADPNILVGRYKEVRQIESSLSKEISVILTGSIGVGKSHILENLKYSKPVFKVDSCAGFKQSIISGIVHLSESKEAATQLLYKTNDKGELSTKLSKESLINLCATLCSLCEKKEYILEIGHVDDLTPSIVRALEKLREHFVIITTARTIKPLLSSWIWDFERVEINPLSREDSLRLFLKLTSELVVHSPEYVKNKVHETAEGNPRIITELSERFGKEMEVNPAIVDEITGNYIGRQVKEIDMSLILLLVLGGFAVLRYVGRETDDSSLQMIGGCIMIVLLFARYFFNSTKRTSL